MLDIKMHSQLLTNLFSKVENDEINLQLYPHHHQPLKSHIAIRSSEAIQIKFQLLPFRLPLQNPPPDGIPQARHKACLR